MRRPAPFSTVRPGHADARTRTSSHPALPLALCVGLAACSGADDSAVATPPGLDPLEENAAALPADESVNFVSSDPDGYHDTNARGRILATLDAVTACVNQPEVGVDRRRVAEYSVTSGVDDDYPVSYDVITTVDDIVTLTYTLTWLQGEREDGSWGVRWSKAGERDTDVNANLLESLEGSVLLQAIDAGTADEATDVGIIEHLDATMTSTEDTEQYTGDFYASLVACAHGEDLPTY